MENKTQKRKTQKWVFLSVIVLLALVLSACNTPAEDPSTVPATVPAVSSVPTGTVSSSPGGAGERELLMLYLDGEPLRENGFTYADIEIAMHVVDVDGISYYAASVKDIFYASGQAGAYGDTAIDVGAFFRASDGFMSYGAHIGDIYLAVSEEKNGVYESLMLDGKAVYNAVIPGAIGNKGVVSVYMVTTQPGFEVEIQQNGVKLGTLTFDDFMQKTTVGEEKIATGMFDGSFKYNSGSAIYTGEFLGISYEMMLAKLASRDMEISGTIVEAEYYGTNTVAGTAGKNTEYAPGPDHDKYFGSVDFFCMFDGRTYNNITADSPIGLTAFINGTGSRWMTYNLSAINFITE